MKLIPGTLIDESFELDCVLSEGAMGTVYKAHDIAASRPVAMQFIASYASYDDSSREQLQKDASKLRKLRHHNIAEFYRCGVWRNLPYLTMELCEGIRLQTVLDSGQPLKVDRTVRIAKQICEALQAAHMRGFVHRDLKPDNIVLYMTPDGSEIVRVTGFGIAQLLPLFGKEVEKLAKTAISLDSFSYMSPEQCSGGNESIDRRTDIYSLAAIMHHCLTGKPLFSSVASTSVMYDHLHLAPPPVARADGAPIPERLQQIIFKALSKAPADRFGDAEEMKRELDEVHIPRSRRESGKFPFVGFEKPGRKALNTKQVPLVAICIAVGLAIFVPLLLWNSQRDTTSDPDQNTALASIQYYSWEKELDKTDSGELKTSAESPDQLKKLESIYLANKHDHSLDGRPALLAVTEALTGCYLNAGMPSKAWPLFSKRAATDDMHTEKWRQMLLRFLDAGSQSFPDQKAFHSVISVALRELGIAAQTKEDEVWAGPTLAALCRFMQGPADVQELDATVTLLKHNRDLDLEERAYSWERLASSYMRLNEPVKALECLNQAMPLIERGQKQGLDLLEPCFLTGKLYGQIGHWDKCAQCLELADIPGYWDKDGIFHTSDSFSQRAGVRNGGYLGENGLALLATAYEHNGNHGQALRTYSRICELSSSAQRNKDADKYISQFDTLLTASGKSDELEQIAAQSKNSRQLLLLKQSKSQ